MQPITDRLEETEAFDPVADAVGSAFGAIVKPGLLKDALSGTWLGHPLHPALTDVPIGAWNSAAMLDLIGGEKARPAADLLVGIGVLAAVPTAITGWSEFADMSGDNRRVGVVHGLGNAAALLLFAGSWAARRRGHRAKGVTLSMLGNGIALMTAYLGGHLSFARGVGVNQTAFEEAPSGWTEALATSDLPEGKPKLGHAGDVDILLYRKGDRIYALSDRCTHRGGPLHEGDVDDEACTVECPWHGSVFRLEDGGIESGPATAPQPAFEARIRGDKIEVRPRG